ncbi:DUF3347 domain-containing protein [Algivirga pacifica]|uniref:DUF3347 domain-containing protein n=1 Tax=Algivirga pacifica TaxID=1162670 RepID=A0ABP9DEL8_9BACT
MQPSQQVIIEDPITASAIDTENGKEILQAYFDIKNALVESEQEKAKKAAQKLIATAGDNQEIAKSTALLVAATSIEKQREAFEMVSEHVYHLAVEKGLSSGTIYRQFCPMAFSNKGAYWLSDEEKILNPYFGDKMLHCGSVKEVIE